MTHSNARFRIGNEVGVVGRWYRLFLGAFFLAYSILDPVLLHPMPRAELAGFAGEVGLALSAIVLLYLVVFGAIGEWVLAKVTPWVGTLIFLGIPSLLFLLGVLPVPVRMAWGLYVSASLILTFFMRYGGCEVVSFPSIVLRRRYTMYCPLNGIDTVERAVSLDLSEWGGRIATILSFAIVTVVGGAFLLVEARELPSMFGIDVDLDNRWALALLFPVAHLVRNAWRARDGGGGRPWSYTLGAGVLVLALLVFLFDGLTDFAVWRGVMVLGAVIATWQLAGRARGALETRRAGGPSPTTAEDDALSAAPDPTPR